MTVCVRSGRFDANASLPLPSLLNKITPEKFERIMEQLLVRMAAPAMEM